MGVLSSLAAVLHAGLARSDDAEATATIPATATPAPPMTVAPEGDGCPAGMIEIEGDFCPELEQRCLRWVSKEAEKTKGRCLEFAPSEACAVATTRKRFCIDRYEFPNRAGESPAVMKTWHDARAACSAEGKRLCTESEWTFACEGEAKLPYPYGFERNAEACNIDRHYRDPNFSAFSHDRLISDEVSRLDQRVPSGAMSGCVSPFGVHDMTGNVDEWVVNEDPKLDKDEDVSSLKGGYWGPIRARCRPVTNSHNRWFRFYQVGFRCCADPKGSTQPVLP